jgi:hypothetical protein
MYEAIFDFCYEQVSHIHIKKTEDDNKLYCEPIQRFMIDISNGEAVCYTIFSNQRENFDKTAWFIIRKLLWEKEKDISRLEQFPDKRKESLTSWPTISAKNIILRYDDALEIRYLLQQTNELAKNGIVLNERVPDSEQYWNGMKDIEFMRRYEWGEIRYSWGSTMQNTKIEQLIFSSTKTFDNELLRTQPDIYKMEIDYIISLDEFQKTYSGIA